MIHRILLYLRKTNQINQKDLSKKLGIPPSTYSSYENQGAKPSYENVEKIAKELGYDIVFVNRLDKRQVTSKNVNQLLQRDFHI